VAKRNPGRRGRSRKRRSKPKPADAHAHAQGASEPATPSRPAARGARRDPGALGELQSFGERPHPPWHPLPLSELLILVGAIGVIVAWQRGIQSEATLLAASIAAVVIGTVEVTLREHLGGYRSHTIMLAVIPAIVFHSVVVLGVVAISGQVPRWLNVALLPVDAVLVAVFYKLLRARFVDARRERVSAAGR
jgi:hypothetical protein